MTEEKRLEIWKWLVKSQHDLGSAARLLEGEEPYLDTAVCHWQQGVEKALKAFLTLHDLEVERTHDLTELLEKGVPVEPALSSWRGAAQELTPYAVTFQYPGDVLEPEMEEAKRALGVGRRFVSAIEQFIPFEARPRSRR